MWRPTLRVRRWAGSTRAYACAPRTCPGAATTATRTSWSRSPRWHVRIRSTPESYGAWVSAANSATGYFGPSWTWASSICAVWPFHDAGRYLGPFDHHTANPVLVVGNLFDPATR